MWTISPNLLWFLFCFRTNLTASAHTYTYLGHFAWVLLSSAPRKHHFTFATYLLFGFLFFHFFISFCLCGVFYCLFFQFTHYAIAVLKRKISTHFEENRIRNSNEIEPQNVSVKSETVFTFIGFILSTVAHGDILQFSFSKFPSIIFWIVWSWHRSEVEWNHFFLAKYRSIIIKNIKIKVPNMVLLYDF